MSSKSVLIILSYTVSKLVRVLKHSGVVYYAEVAPVVRGGHWQRPLMTYLTMTSRDDESSSEGA